MSRATNALILKQKLPAKMYLGVSFRDDESIRFSQITMYDAVHQEYRVKEAKQVI